MNNINKAFKPKILLCAVDIFYSYTTPTPSATALRSPHISLPISCTFNCPWTTTAHICIEIENLRDHIEYVNQLLWIF